MISVVVTVQERIWKW